ncbi:MAG TPA: DUF1579 domain-containing protein [Thermoanaerobaculia bacterium]|nr:DUF1579 domain-containing protein [Thermoanaerobaculia bacterium]
MRSKVFFTAAVCLIFAISLFAQHDHPQMSPEQMKLMEAYQKASTPGDAHRLLDQMAGTWNVTLKWWPAPGAPAQESAGVSENRWILGGRYVEQRFNGTAMGQPFEGIGYTGYDNIRKEYFGTWIDSMSTALMTTTGTAEEGGKKWTFKGTMGDPVTGKAMAVEEKITVVSPDRHVFEMWTPGPDGAMFRSMEITYTRKK